MGCCCEWRAPPQLRYVLPTIVVAIIAWLYVSFTWFAQPLLVAMGVHWTELLAFHVMTLLLCTSLARCLLSTDSFVPKNTHPRQKRPHLQREAAVHDGDNIANDTTDTAVQHLQLGTMVESKMNGDIRYCRKCRAIKPDRAHHCSTCRRCVLKMDHHCIYINKCIGYYNYKFFLLFLGWSATTCLYESSLVFRYLLADSIDQTAKLYVHDRLALVSPSLQVLLVFFASFCLGTALACFYVMHLFFTLRNYSTVEYCEKRREPFYVNVFDVSVVANVCAVFGPLHELPLWFIPVQSASVLKTRGRRFLVNAKYAIKED